MRLAFRLIALLSISTSAAAAQTLSETATHDTRDSLALIALEKSWCDATVSGDTSVVQSLLAASFVGQSSSGRKLTREDEVAEVRNRTNNSGNTACEHRNSAVHLYGDVAIVTTHTFTSGMRNGSPFTNRHAVSMDTYIRLGGRWLCISSFASSVPQT